MVKKFLLTLEKIKTKILLSLFLKNKYVLIYLLSIRQINAEPILGPNKVKFRFTFQFLIGSVQKSIRKR